MSTSNLTGYPTFKTQKNVKEIYNIQTNTYGGKKLKADIITYGEMLCSSKNECVKSHLQQ